MLEVRLQPDSGLQCPPLAFSDSGVSSPLDWSVSFEFRAETLKHFNPLPHVLQLLLEVHDLRAAVRCIRYSPNSIRTPWSMASSASIRR